MLNSAKNIHLRYLTSQLNSTQFFYSTYIIENFFFDKEVTISRKVKKNVK
jgi:hypothetical protein